MKEYALKGVKTYPINILPDERGFFSEALRTDWKDFLEGEQVNQINLSYSYPNIVRAWHKHLRGQIDHFLVVQGAMKICAYDEETGKMAEVVASGKKPTVVRIPGKYLHGTKTVSSEPSLLVYFVNNLYEYKNPDSRVFRFHNRFLLNMNFIRLGNIILRISVTVTKTSKFRNNSRFN